MAIAELHLRCSGVEGIEQFRQALIKVCEQMIEAGTQALRKECTDIMIESLRQVPKDTGALSMSWFIEDPVITEGTASVEFGYGRHRVQVNPKTGEFTSGYAIKVHEDMHVRHYRGKAKYLEDPVMAFARILEQRLAVDIVRGYKLSAGRYLLEQGLTGRSTRTRQRSRPRTGVSTSERVRARRRFRDVLKFQRIRRRKEDE